MLQIDADGWFVAGATAWRRIRKYKVPAALGRENHGDVHNIAGLVNEASEQACEVVAFTRDVDSDPERTRAIAQGIAHAQAIFPLIGVIGGPAIPAIEGWILALSGMRDTESMSRIRANEMLDKHGIGRKDPEAYASVVSTANLSVLPPGCDKLRDWIDAAKTILPGAIHGSS